MRALITRPRDDAERIAAPLRERGIDILLDPLLSIRFSPPPAPRLWRRDPLSTDLAKSQAIVFTSANGVRAFASLNRERDLPVYAVGETTAQVARDVGFRNIESAGGDVQSLADLIKAHADPHKGPLLHACGATVAGDLGGLLASSGFTVIRHVLYEARPATVLINATLEALREGTIDVVFLFSPRTAQIFSQLVRQADLTQSMHRVVAYALSPAVAEALGDLPFQKVRVAEKPSQESLLTLFDADCATDPTPSRTVPSTVPDAKEIPSMNERPENPSDKSFATEKTPPYAGQTNPGVSIEKPADAQSASAPSGSAATSDAVKSPWSPATAPARPDAAALAPAASPSARNDTRFGGAANPSPPRAGNPAKAQAGQNAPRKRGGFGCLTMILLLLLIALAAPGGWNYWRNQIPSSWGISLPDLPNQPVDPFRGEATSKIGLLGRKVDEATRGQVALKKELEEVREIAREAVIPVDLSGPLNDRAAGFLNRRLDEFQRRLDEISGSTVTAANMLSLSDRVTNVERIAGQTQIRRLTALSLLLTTSQMREAIDRGEPFLDSLRTIEALVRDNPAIDSAQMLENIRILQPLAEGGVMPRATLRETFADTARLVTVAVNSSDGGWVDQAWSSVKSVVVVRRTNVSEDQPDPLNLLAVAETMVNHNDLLGARNTLSTLRGKEYTAAESWLNEVSARLLAEQAVSNLTSLSLAEISASRVLEAVNPDTTGKTDERPVVSPAPRGE